MKKWEKYSKNQLQEFLNTSISYSEVAEKCGYLNARTQGGEQINVIKRMIEQLDLDDSHIKGKSWRKDQFDYSRFKYGNNIKAAEMLKAMIYLRGRCCQVCNHTDWNGVDIPLEVHHLDGDRLNNTLENLQIICPNCHALTETYRGKNNTKSKSPVSDEQFVEALKSSKNIRQALLLLGLTPKGANYFRAKSLVLKYNICNIKF